MVSGLVQAFTTSGLSILKGYAEYATRLSDRFMISGFLNAENCNLDSPMLSINNQGPAQFHTINRQMPVAAVNRADANYHSYTYPVIKYAASQQATVASSVYMSGEISGSVMATTEANIGLTAFNFDRFTNVNGSSIEGGADGLIRMQMAAHGRALDIARQKAFFDNIERNHDIKNDGDGLGPTGGNVTFANDCPRAALAQQIDLSATNVATAEEKRLALIEELLKAVDSTASGLPALTESTTHMPFCLLPATAYNRYRMISDPLVNNQQFYKNVSMTTPGDMMITPQQIFFDMVGIRFVKFPDWFFKTMTTTTANDTWKCYILPSSAVRWMFQPVSIASMLSYQGESLFMNAEVARAVVPLLGANFYGAMDSHARADDFLEEQARKYGRSVDPIAATNVYKAYWDRMPAGTSPDAMAYTFQMRMNTAVIRTQPHFIQAWNIEKALV